MKTNAFDTAAGLLSGVDALFSQTGPEFSLIFIDQIEVGKQVREEFDDEENSLSDLAASIRENGVIQPILVRPSASGYALVAGERRYRASKLVGLDQIPAIIRDLTDEEADDMQLAENIHRKNLTQIEEARKLQRDLERLGSVEAVLQKHHKSNAWLSKRLTLLTLPEHTQRLVKENISADLEVIQSVQTIEKKDAVAAAKLVDELKATRGKESAREKVATVKEQVKPRAGTEKKAREKSKDTQDTDLSSEPVFAYAKNIESTDFAPMEESPRSGAQVVDNLLRKIFDDLVKGDDPDAILGMLSVDSRTDVVKWLRGFHDAGKACQNIGRAVLFGFESGQFAIQGEGALALVAFLQGKGKFDVVGIFGGVK